MAKKLKKTAKAAKAGPPEYADKSTPFGVRRDYRFPGTAEVAYSTYSSGAAAQRGAESGSTSGGSSGSGTGVSARGGGGGSPGWIRRARSRAAALLRTLTRGPAWAPVRGLVKHVIVVMIADALVRAVSPAKLV